MAAPRWVTACALAALMLLPVASATVDGTVESMDGEIPGGRWGARAEWTGRHAYILGGQGEQHYDQILRYDPVADDFTVMNATLPEPGRGVSTVWTGEHIYAFGGNAPGAPHAKISRYDPAADNLTVMDATLPVGNTCGTAVWTGEHAYIFGGKSSDGFLDTILRYDPATDTLTTLDATLPTPRDYTSAVWTGRYAWVFGGDSADGGLDEVLRFDPATGALTVANVSLPQEMDMAPAVWTGRYAYLLGGRGEHGRLDTIVRFDPDAGNVTTMNETLPVPRFYAAAFWTGRHAYAISGNPTDRDPQVVRYDPSNQRPVARVNATTDGLTVHADASASLDTDGTVAGYVWDWDDTSREETMVPTATHTYASPGTYVAELVVVDDEGTSSLPVRFAVQVTAPSTPLGLPGGPAGLAAIGVAALVLAGMHRD